jgi:hypothetical protein
MRKRLGKTVVVNEETFIGNKYAFNEENTKYS